MSYGQWCDFVNRESIPEHVTIGEFIYCELHAVRPKIARMVDVSRSCDPFNDDDNMERLFEIAKEYWDE